MSRLSLSGGREAHLKRGGEEVVLRHDIHKEVRRDFSQLMVEDGDEAQIQVRPLLHGLLRAAQQSQQVFPVLEGLVHIPREETNKGELQLSCRQRQSRLQHCRAQMITRFIHSLENISPEVERVQKYCTQVKVPLHY